jgi:Zn-dependent peptidase ImmA (M78 family)/transcriptional regulator with XRE-family HTH domain
MARAANINHEILVWARESAGLSLEDAANRLGLSSSETNSAAETLEEFEAGENFPTRIQLAKLAAVYRRPLITFYMKQPPQKGARGDDFRTLPAAPSPRENAMLDALLRDIRARQEMVKSLLEDEEETAPHDYVGSATIRDGVQAVANNIAETLGFAVNERRTGTPEDLFKELRNRAEQIGVFVVLVGDLGSHHSSISETVFRGFVIADKIAPFVVINDQDAKTAHSFTLLHELAHIWLGQTGISGGEPQAIKPATTVGKIEQFCNDVAGEFLLPSGAFKVKPQDLDGSDKKAALRIVQSFADTWNVSEPMVAYRLNRLGWITPAIYRELTADYAARWYALKLKAKDKAKDSEGGPSYYVVKQFKLGNALVDVVRRTLRNNELTYTKAAKVLGVKPSSVEPLLRRLEHSRGALIPDLRR